MFRSDVATGLSEAADLAHKACRIIPNEITSRTSYDQWEIESVRPLIRRALEIYKDILEHAV